jgi:hypothetical protein
MQRIARQAFPLVDLFFQVAAPLTEVFGPKRVNVDTRLELSTQIKS